MSISHPNNKFHNVHGILINNILLHQSILSISPNDIDMALKWVILDNSLSFSISNYI